MDWLWWAVDLIASEYGGGPRAILDGLYLDELMPLVKKIRTRQLMKYRMLTIIHHTGKPQELIKKFEDEGRENKSSEFDPVGMEALKFQLSRNPRMIVKG